MTSFSLPTTRCFGLAPSVKLAIVAILAIFTSAVGACAGIQDIVPVARGIYVEEQTSCDAFGGALSIVYDGKAFISPPLYPEAITVRRHGNSYQIHERVTDISASSVAGPAEFDEVVSVINNHSFMLNSKAGRGVYRWCGHSLADLSSK